MATNWNFPTPENGENDEDTVIVSSILTTTLRRREKCTGCDEDVDAVALCIQCAQYLCITCVNAHRRVRLTREHRFSPLLINSRTPTPTPAPSPTCLLHPAQRVIPEPLLCDRHNDYARIYCKTCHKLLCNNCIESDDFHLLHELTYTSGSARCVYFQLNEEITKALNTINKAMETLQERSLDIEFQATKVRRQMESEFDRIRTLFEQRFEQVRHQLAENNFNKQLKIVGQMESVGFLQGKLQNMFNKLNPPEMPETDEDLLLINEDILLQYKYVRQIKPELTPCVTSFVEFEIMDKGLAELIAKLGYIVSDMSLTGAMKLNPICRPIYGVRHRVSLANYYPDPPRVYGSPGCGDGEFARPWGVCVDKVGNIFIADRGNNRIQVFNSSMKFLHKFGTEGSGPGQFNRPAGICYSPFDQIIVCDKDNHRIQVFKYGGIFVYAFGEQGIGRGQFHYPWDVACNARGEILVSDTRNRRVQMFTGTGAFLAQFEHFNPSPYRVDAPRGVCFSPSGRAVLTDFNSHRIMKFTEGGFKGYKPLLPDDIKDSYDFQRPQGIACDDYGNYVVADSKNGRIQILDPSAKPVFILGTFGRVAPGEFNRPSGIAITISGQIIIVDAENNRIQIYDPQRMPFSRFVNFNQ